MEYEIKPQSKLTLGFAELWQYRELFYFFTWRDVKVKYKQTILGFLWAVLQPFLMMIVFTVFFGRALKVPSENIPYPVFVFSGLILWNVFSSGLTAAGNSMVSNANIIKKIYFPRLIIPISAVLVALFDFLMSFMIFIGMLLYFKTSVDVPKFILFIPVGLLIASISTFGLGSLLAALNIKYRDFRYVIPFMVQALLFLTPVIYPVSIITHQWMKYLLALNPMYAAIELFRSGIVNNPIDLNLIAISLVSAVVFFIGGIYYFRKTESYFADLA
ncbi:MAG TPA: ABC transporter permease [Bacteroidia bacterium]|nr:ABC transporter permease [Bacteroidia bacterium]